MFDSVAEGNEVSVVSLDESLRSLDRDCTDKDISDLVTFNLFSFVSFFLHNEILLNHFFINSL